MALSSLDEARQKVSGQRREYAVMSNSELCATIPGYEQISGFEVNKRLYVRYRAQGLKQCQAAEFAGIHVVTASKWEHEEWWPAAIQAEIDKVVANPQAELDRLAPKAFRVLETALDSDQVAIQHQLEAAADVLDRRFGRARQAIDLESESTRQASSWIAELRRKALEGSQPLIIEAQSNSPKQLAAGGEVEAITRSVARDEDTEDDTNLPW